MGCAIEHQHPPRGPVGIGHHHSAVVDRLNVAAAGCDRDGTAAEEHENCRSDRRPPATYPELDHCRGEDQRCSEPDHDAADRQPRDEYEAGDDGADDGPGGADRRESSDDRPGLVEAGQPQLCDHRRYGSQERAGHDDREGGDQHQQRPAIERARRPYGERSCGHRHSGHRQQRTQRPARRHHIGYSASSPAAQGNGSQRNADDQGARLQGETEVRGQQPQRDHLDDKHASRCAEDQCRRRVPAQLRRGRMCDDDLARFAAHRWIMPRRPINCLTAILPIGILGAWRRACSR